MTEVTDISKANCDQAHTDGTSSLASGGAQGAVLVFSPGANPNEVAPEWRGVYSPEALDFVTQLVTRFEGERRSLLLARIQRQQEIDQGKLPDFRPETREIREREWKVRPAPADLQDRRVEITGPATRKMVINALNSGAKVYMADLEDSHSPTWLGTLDAQRNLADSVRRKIDFVSPEGKRYALNPRVAVLKIRPRGWHLPEKHIQWQGAPISGALFDFGIAFFNNAKEQCQRGTAPYFYLPKIEWYEEAALWRKIFEYAEDTFKLPRGTIRATVLIETLTAAFQMHEILWELKDHIVGLNCGRWDYIFSTIKKLSAHPQFVLPDRSQVTMTVPFLKNYSELLVQTCHRRGAHAMGGMAAFIPIKDDPKANETAIERVRQDKLREVRAGHDGTWVAHPGLVPIAMSVFNEGMPGPNQLNNLRPDVKVSGAGLLDLCQGDVTEAGARTNIRVALLYLESWLRGSGCVPIDHLMEDAATAEISRAQLWQWLLRKVKLSDGRAFDQGLYTRWVEEELARIKKEENVIDTGDGQGARTSGDALATARVTASTLNRAREILDRLVTQARFEEFLTLPAYEQID